MVYLTYVKFLLENIQKIYTMSRQYSEATPLYGKISAE